MVARTLLFIKHRLPWLWLIVEWLNTQLYRLLHERRMATQSRLALQRYGLDGFTFRHLGADDLLELESMLRRQGAERVKHFQPHGFDQISLENAVRNPAFLMFGVFHERALVGYFFLRCFWNRKCFVGRLIDEPFERLGIGRVMNRIMYDTAWRSGFRCMTTVSRDNEAVMRSHANNPFARTLGSLANNYLLIEFVEVDPGSHSSKDNLT